MHDLNTIARLNAEAVDKARKEHPGRTFVCETAGLHIVRTDEFDSQDEALAYVERRRPQLTPDASLHIV